MARIAPERIASIRKMYDPTYDRIRADHRLTPGWQQREIAVVWLKEKRRIDSAQERADKAELTELRAAQAKVLGIEGVKGDNLILSQRDAADRVRGLKTPQEALDVLEEAQRGGDEVLARAIAGIALKWEWIDVANRFLAERPEEMSDAFSLLWAHEHGPVESDLSFLADGESTMWLKPRELNGLSDREIERLASEARSEQGTAPALYGAVD